MRTSESDDSGTGTFQVSPDTLVSTAPQFTAAGTAISGVASSLKSAVANAISSFDGDTHKNLQTLGDSCVKNLQDLADALNEISKRLKQAGQTTTDTDTAIANGFDPNH